jgi:peptidoglycan hydrolase-like protein with peptidoglycan-binding domain
LPKLSSPVGRGAPNRQHDVALVQAALASLPSTNNPFGPKIWSKLVDGRASPELEAAIHQFQSVNRINPTGRVNVMGADMQIMDRLLPQDRKGIAAVENCTAVLCSGLQSHMVGEARRVAKERTLLPSAAAEQLSDFIRNIQNQMSLTLCPDGHAIDFQGRMVQKLAFADTHWLNGQGQFTPQAPADKAQQVVSALQRRPLPSLLEWHTEPLPIPTVAALPSQRVGNNSASGGNPFGNSVLAVRVRQRLRCLSGPPKQVDPQRLQRLGLRQTGDVVVDRMQDVAAPEIEAGNAGANELGWISDMLGGLFDGEPSIIGSAEAGQGNGILEPTPQTQELEALKSSRRLAFKTASIREQMFGAGLSGAQVNTALQDLVIRLTKISPVKITITDVLRESSRSHHSSGHAVDIRSWQAREILSAIGNQETVSRLRIDDLIYDAGVVDETDRSLWNFNGGRRHQFSEKILNEHKDHIHVSVRH